MIVIDQTLSRDAAIGLMAACDAVVSLHRSEGLGLLVAEAMVMGRPVIATDFSATTELVTPNTGYPVDFRLIPVEEGQYPFHTSDSTGLTRMSTTQLGSCAASSKGWQRRGASDCGGPSPHHGQLWACSRWPITAQASTDD